MRLSCSINYDARDGSASREVGLKIGQSAVVYEAKDPLLECMGVEQSVQASSCKKSNSGMESRHHLFAGNQIEVH